MQTSILGSGVALQMIRMCFIFPFQNAPPFTFIGSRIKKIISALNSCELLHRRRVACHRHAAALQASGIAGLSAASHGDGRRQKERRLLARRHAQGRCSGGLDHEASIRGGKPSRRCVCVCVGKNRVLVWTSVWSHESRRSRRWGVKAFFSQGIESYVVRIYTGASHLPHIIASDIKGSKHFFFIEGFYYNFRLISIRFEQLHKSRTKKKKKSFKACEREN